MMQFKQHFPRPNSLSPPYSEPENSPLNWRFCLLIFAFLLLVDFFPATAQQNTDADAEQLSKRVVELIGQAKFAEAIPLAEQVVEIRKRTVGEDHPDFAASLNNLAVAYRGEGKYREAEPLMKRSLAIIEKTLGPDDPDVAIALNNLAALLKQEGKYGEAEPLYKRCLEIWETRLGPEHPNVATGLNNLAVLYKEQGKYSEAEPLYLRSLAINEKALGPNHPNVAGGLNNLGALLREEGRYAEAEPLYKRCLQIREHTVGPDSPLVATTLNNLAAVYHEQGRYAEAEALCKRSLAIREKTLGPNHPEVANALNNLAYLYMEQGKYSAAETLFKRSLAIYEQTFGNSHHRVAISLNNLASLLHAEKLPLRASALYERSLAILRKEFDYDFTYMSEKERLEFLQTVYWAAPLYFSLCVSFRDHVPQLAGRMYDLVLWEKGLIAQSGTALRARIQASGDPEALRLLDLLTEKRNQLARLVSLPLASDPQTQAARRAQFEEFEKQVNDLEKELVAHSSLLGTPWRQSRLRWQQLYKFLKPNEAAVEIVRFNFYNGKKWTDNAIYVALVLTPASKLGPVLIRLGDAAKLEAALQVAYYKRIAPPSIGAPVSSLSNANCSVSPPTVSLQTNDGDTSSGDPLEFYRLFWKRLEPAIRGAKRIYISTDGALNQIALNLIEMPGGHMLMDTDVSVWLLNRTADLLQPAAVHTHPSAVLFANPDFNLTETGYRKSLASLGTRGSVSQVSGAVPQLKESGTTLSGCTQLSQVHSLELGVTNDIAPMLQEHGWTVKTYVEEQALAETVEQVQAPRVLHIATHGDFLADPAAKNSAFIEAADTPFPLISDPMLRSRLFFAGANHTLADHPLPSDLSNGILTAYQASTLNLYGTELVVLSACDTGRGDVQDGEGVFGLRRAFQEAGAESLLMTLWEVPAVESQELLNRFYLHWISDSMDKHEALLAAQREERDIVQRRYGSDLPYYWGAFILVGR